MPTPIKPIKAVDPTLEKDGFRFLYLADLLKLQVRIEGQDRRLGKLSDLVVVLKEPYPEAIGLFLEHGWGKPTEYITWDHVRRIEKKAIVVRPPDGGAETYPPFTDQPGWMLVDSHLVGRSILDMDGRRTEVVNDVQLLESKGHLVLVHVDTSLRGILRRWGLGRFAWIKEELISWKYVQPLSVEDVTKSDKVSLSITRSELKELPPEDLADALEELSGEQQEALFSALDSETAAEVLVAAEPRAQRQLIADLRKERARGVFSEMSVPQLVNVFSVLPHSDKTELLTVLPADVAKRIDAILAEREAKARDLMDGNFVAFAPETKVVEVLAKIRKSGRERREVSYIYVVSPASSILLGVVDLRELVLASDEAALKDLMASPVVSAEEDDLREDVADLFAKYNFRTIPVVDSQDHMRGVVRYRDIMANPDTRAKE
jgi:magnesium transporter